MLWFRYFIRIFSPIAVMTFLVACADYVEQIDDQIAEYEAYDKAKSESTCLVADYYVDPKEVFEGTLVDSRDGQVYRTVTIGALTWMAENLNYETDNSYCYDDVDSNCTTYGRLYTWAAAMDSAAQWSSNAKGCGYGKICVPTYPVRGVCPEGWHLPNQGEWETLQIAVGGSEVDGQTLKSISGWDNNGGGSDDYGFSMLPSGAKTINGKYFYKDAKAFFWLSTEGDKNGSFDVSFVQNAAQKFDDKSYAFSVRCVKDIAEKKPVGSSSSSEPESSDSKIPKDTFTDERDGKVYEKVTIGDQVWMAENLNYELDGSSCFIGEDPDCTKYGRFYTWDMAMEACPSGWHLPTWGEFETLLDAVGGKTIAGEKLKSTRGWEYIGKENDSYGFSAVPSCDRIMNEEECDGSSSHAYFWSSTIGRTEQYNDVIFSLHLINMDDEAYRYESNDSKGGRFGWQWVRCIQGERQAVSYEEFSDDRDGQTYRTVKIGDQIWMAENLNYEVPNSYCSNYADSNCTKYGRLYTWAAAVGKTEDECGYGQSCEFLGKVQGVCPVGWHLPSKQEWEILYNKAGRESMAGNRLKSFYGWNTVVEDGGLERCNGTDIYGFTALPGGLKRNNGPFSSVGGSAHFWSSTEEGDGRAYELELFSYSYDNVYFEERDKNYAISVRCIKGESIESSSSSNGEESSSSMESSSSFDYVEYMDPRDGRVYKTIEIGRQTWFAENLRIGKDVPGMRDMTDQTFLERYCVDDDSINCERYGALYQWAEAMQLPNQCITVDCSDLVQTNHQGVCPGGWHIPSEDDWNELFLFADEERHLSGKMLKSTSGWSENGNGVDAFGFAAFPVPIRDVDGNFKYEGSGSPFWSTGESSDENARYTYLHYEIDGVYLDGWDKKLGFAVRCIRD